MSKKVKVYVGSVIAAGTAVAVTAAVAWTSHDVTASLMVVALVVLTSMIKLRLPGMPGTYSMNFLFVLAGVCLCSLPETILIGMSGAVAQSLLQTKKRPTLFQIAFNVANLALSAVATFLAAHSLFPQGFNLYRPAVLAFAAAVYFMVNTVLVSGVLYLLEDKSLAEVCGQWYLWSFPYYLLGAAVVGVLPLGGHAASLSSWIFLLPLAYLLHFFYGLTGSRKPEADFTRPERRWSLSTTVYVATVTAAAIVFLVLAVTTWRAQHADRFSAYLLLAILASACKITLPGMKGTLSLGFVAVLVNIVELSLPESLLISALVAVVRCLWKAKQRPRMVQVAFSSSALVVSTGFAYYFARLLHEAGGDVSLPLTVAILTAALYGSNTALVASAIGLAEGRPLSSLWQRCYFYSFPYYMVGAAASALMIFTARQAGWAPAMLVVPMMGLVYVSYRMHVNRSQITNQVTH